MGFTGILTASCSFFIGREATLKKKSFAAVRSKSVSFRVAHYEQETNRYNHNKCNASQENEKSIGEQTYTL